METTVEVCDHSQIAEVRRVVAEIARAYGMAEIDSARAALVATEIASNVVKYGKRGVMAARWFEADGASGVQLVAVDHGPGFVNFAASSRDGQSTGGSLGIGIGAILRTADVFDVFSIEGQGAALFAQVFSGKGKPMHQAADLCIGSRSVPKPGQLICGDAWCSKKVGRWQRVCVVDGLGHGPLAASASAEAVKVFWNAAERDTPVDILLSAHEALKSTRGAVMGVIAIDTAAGVAQFAGVGNIAGVILSPAKNQHLLSLEGIVGFNLRTPRLQTHAWSPNSTLVMNSDGIATRWSLAKAPGLLDHHPALIAAVLHRDFNRDSDDSTIVVARTYR